MKKGGGQEALDDLDHIDDGEEVVLGDGADPGEKKQEGEDAGDDLEVVIDDGTGEPEGEGEPEDKGEGEEEAAGEGEGEVALPAADTDDDENLSAKMRKRIARETRLRLETEERLNEERRARADSDARARSAMKLSTELAIDNLSDKITAKQGALLKAKEGGESAEEIKLQGELNDLAVRKREAENAKANFENEEAAAAERAKKGGGERATVNPLTTRWMERNRWFSDKRFETTSDLVKAIDTRMVKEGYRPTSEDYYIELDKRIHREMPQLRARIRQAGFSGQQRQEQRRPQSGLPVRTQTRANPTQGKNRVVLMKADLENMERFGMDPNSKEHRVQYAREKLSGKGRG